MGDTAGLVGVSAQLTRRSPKTLRAPVIVGRLHHRYGEHPIELDHRSPFQLLVATILAAQSTDKKVNEVTKTLFVKYQGPADFAGAPEEELQRDIYQTGFYRQKTKALQGMSRALLERYDGEVPLRMADLVTLPGVARKTANVVLGEAAPEVHAADPQAGMAVDTHVKRLSRRFGFTRQAEPEKIERDLMRLLPKPQWAKSSLVIILHGRRICDALRPRCADCLVEDLCPSSLIAGRRDLAGQAKGLGRLGLSGEPQPSGESL